MVSAATMTDDELLGLPENGYKYEYMVPAWYWSSSRRAKQWRFTARRKNP